MALTEGQRLCDGCEQDCNALELCNSDELRGDSNVAIGETARDIRDGIVNGDRRETPNARDLNVHELLVVTVAAATVRFRNQSSPREAAQ